MNTMTVDAYLAQFDRITKDRLEQMRQIIREVAPQATERIAYNIPAYTFEGKPLVYFAGYPHHIGLYATPNGHEAFAKEFSEYKQGKGSVQFPHEQVLPVALIRRVVEYRLKHYNG